MRQYFVVMLKTGELLDFDKKCEYVSEYDKPVALFWTQKENGKFLHGIPVDNMLWFKSMEEENEPI